MDTSKSLEKTEEELAKQLEATEIDDTKDTKFFYKRNARHYLADEVRKENREAVLTAAAYHKGLKILVTGKV